MKHSGKICVAGVGAIGSYLALKLQSCGPVCGLTRENGPISRQIKIQNRWETLDLPHWNGEPLSLLFLCCPAFEVSRVLQTILPNLSPASTIVILSNGNHENSIALNRQKFPCHSWRLGYVTYGLSELTYRKYQLTSMQGGVFFGSWDQGQQSPTDKIVINQPGFHWYQNAIEGCRRKWLFNTAINTIAAAFRLPNNGALFKDRVLLKNVFNEAHALGIKKFGSFGADKENLHAQLEELIHATASNENSMVRARRFRRKTEAAFFSGLANAEEHPLLFSLNKKLLSDSPHVLAEQNR